MRGGELYIIENGIMVSRKRIAEYNAMVDLYGRIAYALNITLWQTCTGVLPYAPNKILI